MKEKIMATLMASIMVVVALAAFVTPDQTDGREGDASSPKYIIGTASEVYELGTGQTETAKIDFNYKAYDTLSTPVFKVSDGTNTATVSGNTAIGSISVSISGSNGIYTVTVTGGSTADTASKTYTINMAVTDSVWASPNTKTVDLDYNYAMNIKVVTASSTKLVLVKDTTTIDSTNAETNPLDIQLGKDFEGWNAKIDSNGTKLGSDKYDFYTTGLPAGIYIKSTGEIAGKVISTASVTTSAKTFYVFAVDIATGEKIFTGKFYYTISLASDSFKYEIDDGDSTTTPVYVPYDTVGYTAVKNYDTGNIKVNVVKADGTTALPASSYSVKYTVSSTSADATNAAIVDLAGTNIHDGYFEVPISTFADYTGVVEIVITSGDYKAIIHVMVVGPVVHSGLAPAVTSA